MFCQKCGNKLSDTAKFCNNCGHKVQQHNEVDNTSNENISDFRTASSSRRLANYIIDKIGYFFFAFVVGIILGLIGVNIEPVNNYLLGIMLILGYYIFFEGIWQRTPGKWITKTKVVKEDGTKPDFGQIVGRSFSRLIPFEAFSFLAGGYPVGWHDRFPHTLVVPENYSEADVKKINIEQLKKSKTNNLVVIIIVIFVGIAVIGILASVVLASLNSARSKGQDAAIKANLSNITVQAELYWDSKSTNGKDGDYSGLCYDNEILKLIEGTPKAKGVNPICNDNFKSYAISALLNSEKYFCVDSTGVAAEVNDAPSPDGTECPTY